MKKFLIQLLTLTVITTNAFAQNISQKDVVQPAQVNKVVPLLKPAFGLLVNAGDLTAIKPKMCIDKIHLRYKNSYHAASGSSDTSISAIKKSLTAETRHLWPNGSTIRVKIIGGSILVRTKVIQYAFEWTQYVNIRFRFVEDNDAEIKVRINADGSSWSMIGTQVKDLEPFIRIGEAFVGDIATMNFGWFNEATPDIEFRRTILHEFGHALGFVHEQASPKASIPWDREATYAHFAATDGWSRDEVDYNVFQVYDRRKTQFSNYDRTSIMQYAVDNALTIGDFEIPGNTRLSQTDIDFAKLLYPKPTDRFNKLLVTFKTGDDDLRVNSQAKLIVELNSGSITRLEVTVNGGQPYGNGSINKGEINLPAGINSSNLIRCSLYFQSGKQFEWDTPDNWKIDEVKLEWVEPGHENIPLSVVRGTPLIRMTDGSTLLLFPR